MIEIIKKKSLPSFWKRYEDPLSIGIFVIVIGIIYYLNNRADSGRNLSDQINDQQYINSINASNRSFSIKSNPFFSGKTLNDTKKLFNNMYSSSS